ncbi:MAG: hypothetical protein JXA78_11815 [Anaerolineales bacterium]|nr:hypothetical protein [Anaerolineales bacterium]
MFILPNLGHYSLQVPIALHLPDLSAQRLALGALKVAISQPGSLLLG